MSKDRLNIDPCHKKTKKRFLKLKIEKEHSKHEETLEYLLDIADSKAKC